MEVISPGLMQISSRLALPMFLKAEIIILVAQLNHGSLDVDVILLPTTKTCVYPFFNTLGYQYF